MVSWLEVRNVSKRFGAHLAVDDASFSAGEGEIVCLVGPSGCGKTTMLRMIAGKEIQSRLKITTVFVTHDQEEALTISDRIAVLHAGRVIQEGSPVDIFERPRHSFVAGFIGQSNLLHGVFAGTVDGRAALRTDTGVELFGRTIRAMEPGTPAIAVIRHSRVEVRPEGRLEPDRPNAHHGRIELVNYLGESIQYVCTVGGAERIIASVTIAAAREAPLEAGAEIRISWRIEDCLLIEDASRLEGHGR